MYVSGWIMKSGLFIVWRERERENEEREKQERKRERESRGQKIQKIEINLAIIEFNKRPKD